MRDAVELARDDPGGPDFSRFDSYLFLHAGYGHEAGQLNDILSVFLSADDFESSAAGGPVPADGVEIREAWILPEAVEGSDRAEAGLNGLMAKFFGHQLGLPGLSNFAAGLPGAGGWSLMDVGPNRVGFLLQGGELQTLFGFVPPHPIAWSKARLGWIEPLVVRRDTAVAVAATDRTVAPGQHKAVQVPVSATEYFLIENRQRRGNADLPEGVEPPFAGTAVTWIEPDQVEFSGSGDSDGDDMTGVWLGVEEYDAFVPGSGILIWHVDEAVIAAREAEGGINNDRVFPGIALEEADGEREIGNAFFDRQDVTEGSPADPFFAGEGRGGILSKTLFGPGTTPNSGANTGVASGIRIEVLSPLADAMEVAIRFDGPLPGWPVSLPAGARLQAADLDGDGAAELLAQSDRGVHLFAGGRANVSDSFPGTFLAAASGSPGEPGPVFVASGGEVAASLPLQDGPLWSASLAEEAVLGLYSGPGGLSPEAVLAVATGSRIELLKADTGEVLAGAGLTGAVALGLLPDGGGSAQLLITTPDAVSVLGPEGPRRIWEPAGESPLLPSVAGDLGGGSGGEIISVDAGGKVSALSGEGAVLWQAMLPHGADAPAALGDVDGDGSLEIAVASGAAVDLLRENGHRMPSFPVEFPRHQKLGTTEWEPLLADLDGDGRQEILAAASAGAIAGIDDDGGQLGGFPVLAAAAISSTPVAADLDGDGVLELAALAGDFAHAWDAERLAPGLGGRGTAVWGQGGADAQGSRAVRGERSPAALPGDPLLPADKAYCYPNPVGSLDRAHLRFFLSQPADLVLEVFDAIGRRVEKRRWNAGSPQAAPGENEITWATGDYESGLYLCRLEASGADGSRGHVIVRMAVAR